MSKGGFIMDCLKKLRSEGRKGLIAYIAAGDPSLAATVDIARELFAAGADIIELGIPFSEPLADGPVIQQASCRALAAGVNLSGILHAVEEIRRDCPQPIILMGYYNPIYQYGIRQFVGDAAAAGSNGFIVPDLPFEESVHL
ncbi:MAG TPA: tryptophan synthase subunit alpha, partial [Pelotomaculum sp.]|nr:tryptophan synthase subunit alpha [Pelotomaculum sp.]